MNPNTDSLVSFTAKARATRYVFFLAMLMLAITAGTSHRALAQNCVNTIMNPASSIAAPSIGAGPYTIADDTPFLNLQQQREYNQMTGALPGHTFRSIAGKPGTWITVRSGLFNGTIVAQGSTPLNWTAVLGGTYFIHYNANSSCGTSTDLMNTTIENTSVCPAGSRFPDLVLTAPIRGAGPYTITADQFQSEYNQMTGAIAGHTFRSTAGIAGTWITVRAGSVAGTLVSQGSTPLNWTATAGGTYFIHYNTNSACGGAIVAMTTTVENTTPCANSAQFPAAAFSAPIKGTGIYTITTAQTQSQYNQMTGAVAGSSFQSTAGIAGTYITVRAGSATGALVERGSTPLNWTAAAGGTYFIHYNTNATCGTASVGMTTTVENTTPACANSAQFPAAAFSAPIKGAGIYTITTGQFQSQYNQMTGAITGHTFRSTAGIAGTWITVRAGSEAGALVAQGSTPLNWSAAAGGTYFIHYNTNAACGTAGVAMTTTVENTTPVCANLSPWPISAFVAPIIGAGPYTITTQQFQSEYNQMIGAVAGHTFRSTAGIASTYITVRAGSATGALVANGSTPLDWTAAAGGTYFIHYHTNSICGNASVYMTTTVENTSSCANSLQYPETAFSAPIKNAGPYSIATDQFQEEYNQMTGAVAGNTFRSTAGIAGTWITVRAGSATGALVAKGSTPLDWTAAAGGTYFIHYNTNSACGTAGVAMTTTVENTTPCANSAQFPAAAFTAPIKGNGPYTIVTNQFQQDYNQLTGAVAGHTFRSTASIAGTYITVRAGSATGALVAQGSTPLNWTAAAGGTYFIHYNTNAACGTANVSMTSTVENTTPACTNNTQYPTAAFSAPIKGSGPYTIVTNQFQSEYNQMTGAVADNTFRSTASIAGTWITVRAGSVAGALVAQGSTPLDWTATAGGTYFIHYNTNSVCGTASAGMISTVENTTICANSAQFPAAAFSAPIQGAGIWTISTNQFQSQYNQMTGAIAGHTFRSSAGIAGTWITVRAGSATGALVAQGSTPLDWTAAAGGTYFIHYNTNATCGTANVAMTTMVENTTSCANGTQFPTAAFSAPIKDAGPYTISTNQFQSQYNQLTGAIAGHTFRSTAGIASTYITVRAGSATGSPVAQGSTPLDWTAAAGGTYFIHYNTNSACGTASVAMTTTVENTTICANSTQFPTAAFAAPLAGAVPYTIVTNQFQSEYNQMTGALAGSTFQSTASIAGTYITVRAGSATGALVAQGSTPLDWTAVAGGAYFIHYNANSACGTANFLMTTTVQNISPFCQPSTSTETVSACSSYQWHGNTYTASNNTATWVTTNAAGCDSTVTLNLTINQPSYSTETIVACGSYNWHGTTYTASNTTATWTGTNAAGCDSIVTLNLTINQPSYSTETIVACGSIEWHGTTYTASNNTATWFGTNAAGCDSIVTLNLTINQPSYSTETIVACGSYTWHGTTYTASNNTATWTSTNAAGCDSTVTLNLTINQPSYSTETIDACGSYNWHGTTYTASNTTATWTGTNAAGCDSIVTLNLTINQPSYSTETIAACGSYEWHGNTYTSSNNTATWTGQNATGCDSIVTLNLTINQPSYSTETIAACGSYEWHGNTYTSSNNTATWTGTNAAGCDSIVTLNLTITPITVNATTIAACESYTWPVNGQTYTNSGTYTLNSGVTAFYSSLNDLSSAVAETGYLQSATETFESLVLNNVGYFTLSGDFGAGSPTWTASTPSGFNAYGLAPGIAGGSMALTTQFEEPLTISFSPGVTSFGANIFVTNYVYATVSGTITLTMSDGRTTSFYTDSANGFGGYVSHGAYITSITIATSNDYVTIDNLVVSTGTIIPSCVTEVLNLTINHPSTSTETIVACDSYEWHGTTYTASNTTATWTGTNAAGCDSIVTLNLTINQPSYATETIAACGSYEWYGTIYTESNNTATFLLGQNAAGCDSIVTLNLTINQPSYSTETIVACGISYLWHGFNYFTSNNTATWTGTNAAGCDSVVTLNLTITPQPTGLACYEFAFFNSGTCQWEVVGSQPDAPTGLACYETATFNTTTCQWDVTGTQPAMPTSQSIPNTSYNNLSAFTSAVGNAGYTISATETFGSIPTGFTAAPISGDFGTGTPTWTASAPSGLFNGFAAGSLAVGTVGLEPLTVSFNPGVTALGANIFFTDADFVIIPGTITVNLSDGSSYSYNSTSATDFFGKVASTTSITSISISAFNGPDFVYVTLDNLVIGTGTIHPTLACYETATFNTTTCSWDVTGTQPQQPTGLACYETASFNNTTCAWDVTGTQPAQPTLACYETASFNTTSCQWDVTGTPLPAIVTTETSCDNYSWINGATYTQSGTYYYSVDCQDYQLNLTINTPVNWYLDADGDGHYTNVISSCTNPGAGYSTVQGIEEDCDDSDASVWNFGIFFNDNDGDGYGSPAYALATCYGANIPSGYSTNSDDCFDSNSNVYPGATEICNGFDDNCDGIVDFGPLGTPTSVNGPSVVCRSQSFVFTTDAVVGATSYQWTLPSGMTGTSTTNSITVATSSTFAGGNICVRAANSCLSDQVCKTLTVATAASATPGTITGTTAVCANSTEYTYTIAAVANASNYVWTAPANATLVSGQGTTSATFSFQAAYTTGSVSVKSSNCFGTSAARTLTVAKKAISGTPGTVTGPASFCPGTQQTFSIAAVTGASDYTWTAPANASIVSGQGSLSVLIEFTSAFVSGNVTVVSSNCSGTSAARTKAVTRTAVSATPGTVTGPATVCTNTQQTFSIAAVTGASNYTWTAPTGANILSGQGGLSVVVEFTSAFVSGNLTVVSSNCSGTSAARTKAVAKKALPGTVGAISGATAGICSGNTCTYTVNALSNTTSYEWIAPVNASIVSGQGTTSVVVQFAEGFTTGTLSVKGVNCSGTSVTARTLALTNVTATPTVLNGPSTGVCAGTTQTYSTNAVAGATSYVWAVPTGAVINSGQGSTSISVTFPTPFISGAITVRSATTCYTSAAKSLTVRSALAQPGVIAGTSNNLCAGGSFTYTIAAVTGATGYFWNVPAGWIITANTGTSITVSIPTTGFTSASISVAAQNACGYGTARSLTLSALPASPTAITGSTSVCPSATDLVYSTTAVAGVNYTWTVPNGATITSGQGTGSIVVNWGTAAGSVSVRASNACGINTTARTLAVSLADCRSFEIVAEETSVETAIGTELNVYPNPTTGEARITFSATAAGTYAISIVDLQGRVINSTSGAAIEGNNTLDINLSNCSNGVYMIHLMHNDTLQTLRVVKM